jgi:hypothetical protein
MTPDELELAQRLLAKGKEHNWRQGESLAQAAIARAAFERAAALGLTEAERAFADMLFYGAGGAKEPERALYLCLHAFRNGERESLDDTADMLDTYAETATDGLKQRVERAADQAREASRLLAAVESLVEELRRTSISASSTH